MEIRDITADHLANNVLFIKWVKGDKDSKNARYWETFIREHPEMKGVVDEAAAIVNAILDDSFQLYEEEINLMRTGILKQMQQNNQSPFDTNPLMRRNHKLGWIKWAAVVALPVAAIAVYLLAKEPASKVVSLLPAVLSKEVKFDLKGNKSLLRLTDGTKVWLNADSRLQYDENFNKGNTREISLKGEAYFEVFPDAKKPFIVHTSGIIVTVLGTAFNLKAYEGESTIETTVIHGKVGVSRQGADESLILKPNQRAVFKKDTKATNVEQVATENITEWKEDKLVFDETPISEVLSKIEAYYNVKVHLKTGDRLDCTLTGEIGQEGVEEIFKLLEATYSIRYRISGRDIYVDDYFCKE